MHPRAVRSGLSFGLLAAVLLTPGPARAEDTAAAAAAEAVNATGIALYRREAARGGNRVLSPFSIEEALAMTYAGAAGGTRAEMARALHLPDDEKQAAAEFTALSRLVEGSGWQRTYVSVELANQLFLQSGYRLQGSFTDEMRLAYDAPVQELDFERNPEPGRRTINHWVEDRTRGKIRGLLPPGSVDASTRLVLADAIHFQAAWLHPFKPELTKPEPFHLAGGGEVQVPTMNRTGTIGYAHEDGITIVTLPLGAGSHHGVFLVPDDSQGLPDCERRLSPEWLARMARIPSAVVSLHLPKFELAPASLPLGADLRALGLREAFDPKQANFEGMTGSPRPVDAFYVGDVYHQAFVSVGEKGVEAAAATAVAMFTGARLPRHPPIPIEVRVDRPFLFAIQEVSTGACLFLGRVVDPR